MSTEPPILINKKTAAAALGISIRTLEKLVRRGDLESVRVGDRVLFLRDSLERFARAKLSGRNYGIVVSLN